jgi:hypothetical protein
LTSPPPTARQHRQRGARADAGDPDQLAERAALGLGEEAVEQLRVLAHHQVREQRDPLAERRQVVERAHRDVDLVAHALHVEQHLRRRLREQHARQSTDHEVTSLPRRVRTPRRP